MISSASTSIAAESHANRSFHARAPGVVCRRAAPCYPLGTQARSSLLVPRAARTGRAPRSHGHDSPAAQAYDPRSGATPQERLPCALLGVTLLATGRVRAARRAAEAPPPPGVTVAQPVEREVGVDLQATGTVTGVETVEVRARVQGFVEQIHFRAGSVVAEGDLLFTIDPRPFRARLAQAEADLAGREATLQLARSNLAKAKALAKSQVMAAQGSTRRGVREAGGRRSRWRANVDAKARLDLAYTEVRAPIGGRIRAQSGRQRGALVGAAGSDAARDHRQRRPRLRVLRRQRAPDAGLPARATGA